MRRAYIGLSTPIAFDYQTTASKTKADLSSSPNPILESPFGLLLLFDELWFLTRSLCPQNMRKVPYVHFLDEEGLLADLSDLTYNRIWERTNDCEKKFGPLEDLRNQTWDRFSNLEQEMHIYWSSSLDHHTHQLQIGAAQLSASSVWVDTRLYWK